MLIIGALVVDKDTYSVFLMLIWRLNWLAALLNFHLMKLLAKYLNAASFCWTSSTFLADKGKISGKDKPR